MKVVDLEQRTPEWQEWRREGVSATSCAIIMGENPDKTPLELWQELVGIKAPQDLSRIPQVRKGVKLEPLALNAFEEKYGQIGLPICAESSEHPFIRASFDGLLENGSPVEIKNLAEDNHLQVLALREKSPAYQLYYWQVMHQLIVSGASRGYLWFWSPKHEPCCLVVDRDEALCGQIIEAEKNFWEMVETATPPEADPKRDFIPLDRLDLDAVRPIAAKMRDVARQAKALKEQLAALEKQEDELTTRLLPMLGDFRRADVLGVKVCTYKTEGRVSWKAVAQALAPTIPAEVLERCRSAPVFSSRVTINPDFDESKQPPPPTPIVRRKAAVIPRQVESEETSPLATFWW